MKVVAEPPSEPTAAYWQRRAEIAARAAGAGNDPRWIRYTPTENQVWATVAETLTGAWRRWGCDEVNDAIDRLELHPRRVPQLAEVTAALRPWSGFRFEAVEGLVPAIEFFSGLADGRFLSTQYVRWEGSPLYTPEPDVIHEVFGHAHLLANKPLAKLHRLAGAAMLRLETEEARQFVSDVFWFSGEFGVLSGRGGPKAYGAGLLSSIGELEWFGANAEIRPLNIAAMGTIDYDIDHYQPVLFAAGSIDEVLDTVGGFFADCDDATVLALAASSSSLA